MTNDRNDNDDLDDLAKELRAVLSFTQFMICRGRGFPPGLTPAQHNEIMRLTTSIVFLCGEGHSLDVVQPGVVNPEGRESMQHMRDAIAQEIIKALQELKDYYKAVSVMGDVMAPTSAKSPWKM